MSNIEFLYEQLRQAIDGGSESMTHEDALEQVRYWRDKCLLIQPKQTPTAWCLVYHDRRAGPIYSNPTMRFESAEALANMSEGRVEVAELYVKPKEKP